MTQMHEYTLSFSWSVVADHENILEDAKRNILYQLHSTEMWFRELQGTVDEMFYSSGNDKDIVVKYLSHSTAAAPFTTVISIETNTDLDSEQIESILFQVRERILSYTYRPFGAVYAKPNIHSEASSLDLHKTCLTFMK
jgi:hypothetical protein